MLAFVLGISLLAAAGLAYQLMGVRRDVRRFPPPGTMIDTAHGRLHITCAGRGEPLVLFESGIAASSLSWTQVLREVAAFTRACAYDRPGLGWSDACDGVLTMSAMVGGLRCVLMHAANAGPVILVGHSFGAWLACEYASGHPEETAGLVLLDPPSEWHELSKERRRILQGGIHLSRFGGLLARLGVVRACLALLTGGAPGVPRNFVRVFGPTAARELGHLVGEVRKLPADVHPMVQALWCQPKCFRAMAQHLGALEETAARVGRLTTLPAVPLVVISSADQSSDVIARHRQLARLSSRGCHVIAGRSGHWIQFDEPDLVVATIRAIVDSTRGVHAARFGEGF